MICNLNKDIVNHTSVENMGVNEKDLNYLTNDGSYYISKSLKRIVVIEDISFELYKFLKGCNAESTRGRCNIQQGPNYGI